jgi:membrane-associated phospholipid phosphatase
MSGRSPAFSAPIVPSGSAPILPSGERATQPSGDRATSSEPARPTTAPFLEPRRGGPAEQIAARGSGMPVAVPIAGTYLAGWAALSALLTGIGLLLIHVVLAGGAGWDESINRWLADHRTDFLNRVTGAATFMANTLPVVAVLAASCLVLLLVHRWREAVFLAGALTLELTVFLTVNLLTDRARPNVPRLDSTPSTGSFPSGHVAATLALWVGLVLIASASIRQRVVRAVLWSLAILVAAVVAFARAYRGMHHVTDVAAGVALGVASLAVAAFAVRVISAVVALRAEPVHRSTTPEVAA